MSKITVIQNQVYGNDGRKPAKQANKKDKQLCNSEAAQR